MRYVVWIALISGCALLEDDHPIGTATITVGGQEVAFGSAWVTEIDDERAWMLAAWDGSGLDDLGLVVRPYDGPGTYDVLKVRAVDYSGGSFVDDANKRNCTVEINASGDGLVGSVACEGLVWNGAEVSLTGEFDVPGVTVYDSRDDLLVGTDYRWGLYVVADWLGGELIYLDDPDHSLALPCQPGCVSALIEDFTDNDWDDVVFKVFPGDDEVRVDKWVGPTTSAVDETHLVVSNEGGGTVTVQETGVSADGADADVMLWESVHDAGDVRTVSLP